MKSKLASTREFDRAVVPHIASVWRVLRQCGIPDAEADDGTQLVLMQAFRHWSRLRDLPTRQLRSYLCCAAAGTASNLNRSRERERARLLRIHGDEVRPERPDRQLERKSAHEQLARILHAIPEERRVVFILHEVEELTGEEIAEHLGIPPGTVASRLRKAREEFCSAVDRIQAAERFARGKVG